MQTEAHTLHTEMVSKAMQSNENKKKHAIKPQLLDAL